MSAEPCLVVFDVDGTLVDAQVSIINGFVSGFEAAGLTPPSAAAIRHGVGLSMEIAVAQLLPEAGPDLVRRVALLSSEKSNSVKLVFTKNNLEITANTPEVGEAKESIAVQYKGKDFNIAFNPEFLMDPLKNIDSDEIFFDFIDELSPGVIKYKRPFLYVIMPMRTA